MELSFDDLLAEVGMTEARELILLCKRNALPQISRDRPVSKRDANLIVRTLRHKEINWYKYKQRRIDQEERGPVERRIEPSAIEWVAAQYKQLLEREAFTPDDANLSIGVAAQGGFLKGGPAEPFRFSIGRGCNILIGERGTGKSTTLTLLGLLSESTTERTGILAEDVVRQMEYTLTSSINVRRIRKELRSLDIEMYALYFFSSGRPLCFFMAPDTGYEFLEMVGCWSVIDDIEAITFPSIQIFRQGDIFRISDVRDRFILSRLVDLLTPGLHEARAQTRRLLGGVCRQLPTLELPRLRPDREWLAAYLRLEYRSLDDARAARPLLERAVSVANWIDDRVLRGRAGLNRPLSLRILLEQPDEHADRYVYGFLSGLLSERALALRNAVSALTPDDDLERLIDEAVDVPRTRLRALNGTFESCSELLHWDSGHTSLLKGAENYFRQRAELKRSLARSCARMSEQLQAHGVAAELIALESGVTDSDYLENAGLCSEGLQLSSTLLDGPLSARLGDSRESIRKLRRLGECIEQLQQLAESSDDHVIDNQVYDQVEARMLQGATQRTFNQLSFGQRAAVILMMVIQNTDAACLLLDQPEDHLDASSIVGIVGPTINAVCERKSVCIATHNNNLVLGLRGAIITSLQSQGEYGTVVARGPLASSGVMTEMLRILEGGEDSFFGKIEFYGELSRYYGRSLDGAQLVEIGRELRQRTVDELRNLLQPIVTDSALLKTARHELRNILGVSRLGDEGDSLQAILSRSPAGAGMAPASTLVEQVEKILRNWDSHIDLMLAGIDQMRAIDATPKAMQVDLWATLQEVVQAEVRAFGDSRRKRLSIAIDDALRGVYIHFDAAHLRLVLENLIRNALAATGEVSFQAIGTEKGELYQELIEFRLEQLDRRNKYASVYLIDNGIGLTPADACKIYKEKGFTRRPGGQGIGCQIITRFLAVNGGSINVVETRFGVEHGGTAQEIRLPLAKVLSS